MSSSSSSTTTQIPAPSNSPAFGSSGDAIQILNNEFKAILSDLNPKKFPKIKEVNNTFNFRIHIYIHFFPHRQLTSHL